MRFWNALREVEWFAVIAILLLAAAALLAVLISLGTVVSSLWVLAVVFGFTAVVSAIFSHWT